MKNIMKHTVKMLLVSCCVMSVLFLMKGICAKASEYPGDTVFEEGTWELNGDTVTINGDFYVTGGEMLLQGGTLKVKGNIYHLKGIIDIGGGTIEVTGSYYMGKENEDGSIQESYGKLKMYQESDLVKIHKDFRVAPEYSQEWTEGTIEIGGNYLRYREGNTVKFVEKESKHKVIFTGTDDLEISDESLWWTQFANVEIKNASSRAVTMQGELYFLNSLATGGESLNIIPDNLTINLNGWKGKNLTFSGSVKFWLGNLDMQGYTLNVAGNLEMTGLDLYLNGGNLQVQNDLIADAGYIYLGEGNVYIRENLYLWNGDIYFEGGTVEVAGHYEQRKLFEDGTFQMTYGTLVMKNPKDLLKVHGDFVIDPGYDLDDLTEGTIEIGGNYYDYSRDSGGLIAKGNHKVIFTGENDLTILAEKYGSEFANVEIKNAASRTVAMKGILAFDNSLTCDSEKLTIYAQDARLKGSGFSNLNLEVNSDLNFVDGIWSLNDKRVHIKGNLRQEGGSINLEKGMLLIDGNYNNVDGILNMTEPEAEMNVGGDFIMSSTQSHTDKLTAGTLSIQGDFTQTCGSEENFLCSGTHKVILNGSGVQHVKFESKKSKFNKLQLAKNMQTGYIFSHKSCWNELEEKQENNLFKDVKKTDWYYGAVMYVSENKIMGGLTVDVFGANEILTRAQFATILYQLNGKPAIDYNTRFPDIADGQWYTDGVLWASSIGVVGGYGNGLFGPGNKITREQMTMMMYGYAKYKGYDISKTTDISSFSDSSKVNSYAEDALKWAVGNEIIGGKAGNMLAPQGQATRAECAVVMMKFIEQYENN